MWRVYVKSVCEECMWRVYVECVWRARGKCVESVWRACGVCVAAPRSRGPFSGGVHRATRAAISRRASPAASTPRAGDDTAAPCSVPIGLVAVLGTTMRNTPGLSGCPCAHTTCR